ncbi:MAG TPA: hypothetical protein VF260_08840 [Bacilli bacterium]
MDYSESYLLFIIASFAFAYLLIKKKEKFPEKARRPLAIVALFMVVFSFFLIVYSFWRGI